MKIYKIIFVMLSYLFVGQLSCSAPADAKVSHENAALKQFDAKVVEAYKALVTLKTQMGKGIDGQTFATLSRDLMHKIKDAITLYRPFGNAAQLLETINAQKDSATVVKLLQSCYLIPRVKIGASENFLYLLLRNLFDQKKINQSTHFFYSNIAPQNSFAEFVQSVFKSAEPAQSAAAKPQSAASNTVTISKKEMEELMRDEPEQTRANSDYKLISDPSAAVKFADEAEGKRTAEQKAQRDVQRQLAGDAASGNTEPHSVLMQLPAPQSFKEDSAGSLGFTYKPQSNRIFDLFGFQSEPSPLTDSLFLDDADSLDAPLIPKSLQPLKNRKIKTDFFPFAQAEKSLKLPESFSASLQNESATTPAAVKDATTVVVVKNTISAPTASALPAAGSTALDAQAPSQDKEDTEKQDRESTQAGGTTQHRALQSAAASDPKLMDVLPFSAQDVAEIELSAQAAIKMSLLSGTLMNRYNMAKNDPTISLAKSICADMASNSLSNYISRLKKHNITLAMLLDPSVNDRIKKQLGESSTTLIGYIYGHFKDSPSLQAQYSGEIVSIDPTLQQLINAIQADDTSKVMELAPKVNDINQSDQFQFNPMHYAAIIGNEAIIDTLRSRNACSLFNYQGIGPCLLYSGNNPNVIDALHPSVLLNGMKGITPPLTQAVLNAYGTEAQVIASLLAYGASPRIEVQGKQPHEFFPLFLKQYQSNATSTAHFKKAQVLFNLAELKLKKEEDAHAKESAASAKQAQDSAQPLKLETAAAKKKKKKKKKAAPSASSLADLDKQDVECPDPNPSTAEQIKALSKDGSLTLLPGAAAGAAPLTLSTLKKLDKTPAQEIVAVKPESAAAQSLHSNDSAAAAPAHDSATIAIPPIATAHQMLNNAEVTQWQPPVPNQSDLFGGPSLPAFANYDPSLSQTNFLDQGTVSAVTAPHQSEALKPKDTKIEKASDQISHMADTFEKIAQTAKEQLASLQAEVGKITALNDEKKQADDEKKRLELIAQKALEAAQEQARLQAIEQKRKDDEEAALVLQIEKEKEEYNREQEALKKQQHKAKLKEDKKKRKALRQQEEETARQKAAELDAQTQLEETRKAAEEADRIAKETEKAKELQRTVNARFETAKTKRTKEKRDATIALEKDIFDAWRTQAKKDAAENKTKEESLIEKAEAFKKLSAQKKILAGFKEALLEKQKDEKKADDFAQSQLQKRVFKELQALMKQYDKHEKQADAFAQKEIKKRVLKLMFQNYQELKKADESAEHSLIKRCFRMLKDNAKQSKALNAQLESQEKRFKEQNAKRMLHSWKKQATDKQAFKKSAEQANTQAQEMFMDYMRNLDKIQEISTEDHTQLIVQADELLPHITLENLFEKTDEIINRWQEITDKRKELMLAHKEQQFAANRKINSMLNTFAAWKNKTPKREIPHDVAAALKEVNQFAKKPLKFADMVKLPKPKSAVIDSRLGEGKKTDEVQLLHDQKAATEEPSEAAKPTPQGVAITELSHAGNDANAGFALAPVSNPQGSDASAAPQGSLSIPKAQPTTILKRDPKKTSEPDQDSDKKAKADAPPSKTETPAEKESASAQDSTFDLAEYEKVTQTIINDILSSSTIKDKARLEHGLLDLAEKKRGAKNHKEAIIAFKTDAQAVYSNLLAMEAIQPRESFIGTALHQIQKNKLNQQQENVLRQELTQLMNDNLAIPFKEFKKLVKGHVDQFLEAHKPSEPKASQAQPAVDSAAPSIAQKSISYKDAWKSAAEKDELNEGKAEKEKLQPALNSTNAKKGDYKNNIKGKFEKLCRDYLKENHLSMDKFIIHAKKIWNDRISNEHDDIETFTHALFNKFKTIVDKERAALVPSAQASALYTEQNATVQKKEISPPIASHPLQVASFLAKDTPNAPAVLTTDAISKTEMQTLQENKAAQEQFMLAAAKYTASQFQTTDLHQKIMYAASQRKALITQANLNEIRAQFESERAAIINKDIEVRFYNDAANYRFHECGQLQKELHKILMPMAKNMQPANFEKQMSEFKAQADALIQKSLAEKALAVVVATPLMSVSDSSAPQHQLVQQLAAPQRDAVTAKENAQGAQTFNLMAQAHITELNPNQSARTAIEKLLKGTLVNVNEHNFNPRFEHFKKLAANIVGQVHIHGPALPKAQAPQLQSVEEQLAIMRSLNDQKERTEDLIRGNADLNAANARKKEDQQWKEVFKEKAHRFMATQNSIGSSKQLIQNYVDERIAKGINAHNHREEIKLLMAKMREINTQETQKFIALKAREAKAAHSTAPAVLALAAQPVTEKTSSTPQATTASQSDTAQLKLRFADDLHKFMTSAEIYLNREHAQTLTSELNKTHELTKENYAQTFAHITGLAQSFAQQQSQTAAKQAQAHLKKQFEMKAQMHVNTRQTYDTAMPSIMDYTDRLLATDINEQNFNAKFREFMSKVDEINKHYGATAHNCATSQGLSDPTTFPVRLLAQTAPAALAHEPTALVSDRALPSEKSVNASVRLLRHTFIETATVYILSQESAIHQQLNELAQTHVNNLFLKESYNIEMRQFRKNADLIIAEHKKAQRKIAAAQRKTPVEAVLLAAAPEQTTAKSTPVDATMLAQSAPSVPEVSAQEIVQGLMNKLDASTTVQTIVSKLDASAQALAQQTAAPAAALGALINATPLKVTVVQPTVHIDGNTLINQEALKQKFKKAAFDHIRFIKVCDQAVPEIVKDINERVAKGIDDKNYEDELQGFMIKALAIHSAEMLKQKKQQLANDALKQKFQHAAFDHMRAIQVINQAVPHIMKDLNELLAQGITDQNYEEKLLLFKLKATSASNQELAKLIVPEPIPQPQAVEPLPAPCAQPLPGLPAAAEPPKASTIVTDKSGKKAIVSLGTAKPKTSDSAASEAQAPIETQQTLALKKALGLPNNEPQAAAAGLSLMDGTTKARPVSKAVLFLRQSNNGLSGTRFDRTEPESTHDVRTQRDRKDLYEPRNIHKLFAEDKKYFLEDLLANEADMIKNKVIDKLAQLNWNMPLDAFEKEARQALNDITQQSSKVTRSTSVDFSDEKPKAKNAYQTIQALSDKESANKAFALTQNKDHQKLTLNESRFYQATKRFIEKEMKIKKSDPMHSTLMKLQKSYAEKISAEANMDELIEDFEKNASEIAQQKQNDIKQAQMPQIKGRGAQIYREQLLENAKEFVEESINANAKLFRDIATGVIERLQTKEMQKLLSFDSSKHAQVLKDIETDLVATVRQDLEAAYKEFAAELENEIPRSTLLGTFKRRVNKIMAIYKHGGALRLEKQKLDKYERHFKGLRILSDFVDRKKMQQVAEILLPRYFRQQLMAQSAAVPLLPPQSDNSADTAAASADSKGIKEDEMIGLVKPIESDPDGSKSRRAMAALFASEAQKENQKTDVQHRSEDLKAGGAKIADEANAAQLKHKFEVEASAFIAQLNPNQSALKAIEKFLKNQSGNAHEANFVPRLQHFKLQAQKIVDNVTIHGPKLARVQPAPVLQSSALPAPLDNQATAAQQTTQLAQGETLEDIVRRQEETIRKNQQLLAANDLILAQQDAAVRAAQSAQTAAPSSASQTTHNQAKAPLVPQQAAAMQSAPSAVVKSEKTEETTEQSSEELRTQFMMQARMIGNRLKIPAGDLTETYKKAIQHGLKDLTQENHAQRLATLQETAKALASTQPQAVSAEQTAAAVAKLDEGISENFRSAARDFIKQQLVSHDIEISLEEVISRVIKGVTLDNLDQQFELFKQEALSKIAQEKVKRAAIQEQVAAQQQKALTDAAAAVTNTVALQTSPLQVEFRKQAYAYLKNFVALASIADHPIWKKIEQNSNFINKNNFESMLKRLKKEVRRADKEIVNKNIAAVNQNLSFAAAPAAQGVTVKGASATVQKPDQSDPTLQDLAQKIKTVGNAFLVEQERTKAERAENARLASKNAKAAASQTTQAQTQDSQTQEPLNPGLLQYFMQATKSFVSAQTFPADYSTEAYKKAIRESMQGLTNQNAAAKLEHFKETVKAIIKAAQVQAATEPAKALAQASLTSATPAQFEESASAQSKENKAVAAQVSTTHAAPNAAAAAPLAVNANTAPPQPAVVQAQSQVQYGFSSVRNVAVVASDGTLHSFPLVDPQLFRNMNPALNACASVDVIPADAPGYQTARTAQTATAQGISAATQPVAPERSGIEITLVSAKKESGETLESLQKAVEDQRKAVTLPLQDQARSRYYEAAQRLAHYHHAHGIEAVDLLTSKDASKKRSMELLMEMHKTLLPSASIHSTLGNLFKITPSSDAKQKAEASKVDAAKIGAEDIIDLQRRVQALANARELFTANIGKSIGRMNYLLAAQRVMQFYSDRNCDSTHLLASKNQDDIKALQQLTLMHEDLRPEFNLNVNLSIAMNDLVRNERPVREEGAVLIDAIRAVDKKKIAQICVRGLAQPVKPAVAELLQWTQANQNKLTKTSIIAAPGMSETLRSYYIHRCLSMAAHVTYDGNPDIQKRAPLPVRKNKGQGWRTDEALSSVKEDLEETDNVSQAKNKVRTVTERAVVSASAAASAAVQTEPVKVNYKKRLIVERAEYSSALLQSIAHEGIRNALALQLQGLPLKSFIDELNFEDELSSFKRKADTLVAQQRKEMAAKKMNHLLEAQRVRVLKQAFTQLKSSKPHAQNAAALLSSGDASQAVALLGLNATHKEQAAADLKALVPVEFAGAAQKDAVTKIDAEHIKALTQKIKDANSGANIFYLNSAKTLVQFYAQNGYTAAQLLKSTTPEDVQARAELHRMQTKLKGKSGVAKTLELTLTDMFSKSKKA